MVVKRIRPKSRREDAIFEFDGDQRSYLNSPHTLRQIVVAGPGSGKTTVAIQRVVDLDTSLSATQGIEHPSAVLFLSFSRASIRAAAKSMSTDLASLNVEFQAQTIDSLAYEICRYDGQMSLTELDQTDFPERLRIAGRIANAEGENLTYDLRHIFVDEAQDVSPDQADFLRQYLTHLPVDCGVTVFADPDQEIYRFLDSKRESTPRWDYFHQQLRKVCPWKYITFHGQYRAQSVSMRRTLDSLDKVRSEQDRARKTAQLDRVQSRLPTITLDRLANNTASRATQSALLARTNADVTACFDHLRRSGCSNLSPVFPTEWQGLYPGWIGEVACSIRGFVFSSQELRDSFENTTRPNVDPDPTTHLNLGLRRQMTWDEVKEFYDTLGFRQKTADPGHLIISTIHQSKGLEFDDVAILQPDKLLLRDPSELEVLFVALSRARNMTYAVAPPDDLLNFRTCGRRLMKFRYSGKRRFLTHLSIIPGDITVPASLGVERSENPSSIDQNSFISFDPIRSRSVFTYVCKVDGKVVGETTEAFGSFLQREVGTGTPPHLGSVPIAAIETQFVPGPRGLRPILVPIPCGVSEILQSKRTFS